MPKILVVDDNSNIHKMVANALKDQGIEVVGLGNGEAAVKKFSDLNPDLVLADVFMPVRDGYELCQWVKDNERFAHVPVFLLVGAFDPLDEHRVQSVRADGVLKKPFVPPDPLVNVVHAMLDRAKKAKQASAMQAAHHEFAASVPHHEEPTAVETQKLEPEEVRAMTGGAPEPEPMPEYAVQPKLVEFAEGDKTLAFGDLLDNPTELSASIEPPVIEEPAAPSAPSFRASSVPDEQYHAAAVEPAPSEMLHADVAEPAAAIEEPAEEEQPNYGGITEELKQPSPDEPPIKVEFGGDSTPMELVTDDSPAALSSLTAMEPGKLPELVASAGEWAPPPPPIPADTPSLAAELPPMPVISEPEPSPEPAPTSAPLGMPSTELHGLDWHPEAAAPSPEPPPPPEPAAPVGAPLTNPYMVDDVVEKVMAMLQPQIVHQITSELGKAIAELQPQIIERITRDAIRPIAEDLIRKKEK